MSWFSAIAAAFQAIAGFFRWLRERAIADGAVAKAKLQGKQDEDDAISKANAAREQVRADAARWPDGLLRDDGFKRND